MDAYDQHALELSTLHMAGYNIFCKNANERVKITERKKKMTNNTWNLSAFPSFPSK